MSTGSKIPHADAMKAAKAFRGLIIESCQNHCCAGSLRRKCPEVGDIEHVVIGRDLETIPSGGMFTEKCNGVLAKLDMLVAEGVITKQIKSDGKTRWGERYRACVYEGVVHEVFIATADNWGAILAIRTGPAEFSQAMVTRIGLRGRLKQDNGYLVYQSTGERYPCENEEIFFQVAGVPYMAPEDRPSDLRVREWPDTGGKERG